MLQVDNLSSIKNALVAGAEVDLEGVSGSLNFDIATGFTQNLLEVICISPGTDYPTSAGFAPTGQFFDFNEGITGTYECPPEVPE